MAITTTERDAIIKLVIGMFNAAPGATYLSTITTIFEANGHNMTALAQTLSTTSAFQSLYPNFQTTSEFVTSFLTKLGLQTNQTAIDYVTAQVNAGVNKGEIILNAITILDKIDPAVGGQIGAAAGALDNKAAVATYYTVDKNGTSTNLSTLQTVIAGVTDSATTVTTAKASIDAGTLGAVNAGSTFSLTNAVGESIVGTAGDDTINAVISATGATTDSTLNIGDNIDGGAGNDTLNLVAGVAAATLAPGSSIKNVENVNVDVSSFTAAAAALNSASYTGVTKLVEVNNTTGGAFAALTVASGVTAGIKSTGSATTAAVGTVTINGTSQTSQAISLDGVATGGTVTLAGYTALDTISVSGTVATVTATPTETLTGSTTAKTLNLNLTSAANLTIATLTGLTTVDGSASTGALTLANTSLTKLTSLKGGTGADKLSIDYGVNTTTALVADAGAGTDSVTLTSSGTGPANGSSTLTLGAGKDTLTVGANVNVQAVATAADLNAKIITVTDFKTSEDTLNLNGTGVALTGAQLASIAGAADLKAAVTAAAAAGGASKSVVFSFGGDAYVFVNDATAALSVGDGLIKLVGVDATQFTNVQNGNLVL